MFLRCDLQQRYNPAHRQQTRSLSAFPREHFNEPGHRNISFLFLETFLWMVNSPSLLFFPVMAKTRWSVTNQWLLLWGKTLDASFWDLCQTERLHSLHTFTVWQGSGNTPQYKLSSSLCQSQIWIHEIWPESEKDIFPFFCHVKSFVM